MATPDGDSGVEEAIAGALDTAAGECNVGEREEGTRRKRQCRPVAAWYAMDALEASDQVGLVLKSRGALRVGEAG